MIKPQKLNKGDKVAIVSLSKGILGEPFCKHEVDIAVKRLNDMGLEVVFMPNALKGDNYIKEHPEARASDLKMAFMDDSIKGIITAVGGDDTYRTIPYLMEDNEFINAVRNNPKIFTGYSDTTVNHIMLNKIGLSTFYGPCLLADIAELDNEMLPYTKEYFDKFFIDEPGFEIKSSPVWYHDRTSFGPDQIGIPRITEEEKHGYETIHGSGVRTGKLYGGCIESFYDIFVGDSYPDSPEIFEKYHLLPTEDEWKEKILFLETSELVIPPETLKKMLIEFKNRNIFNLVKGIIVGKPIDEENYKQYKDVYKEVLKDIDVPVLYNVNYGHSFPRCIIPYDAEATIDYDNKRIFINTPILDNTQKRVK